MGKTGSFSCNALEDVINEGVHDGHGLAGYTGIRMDLLQYLVYVVRFFPTTATVLSCFGALSHFVRSLSHFVRLKCLSHYCHGLMF